MSAKASNISSFDELKQRLESSLERHLPKDLHPPLSLAMRYSTLAGGKRLRAMLVYASGIAFGAPIKELDNVACAVECIHAYSLIHDDLPALDDDDLRRGKPTNHIAFDEATAILAGDALQTLAFELLSAPENDSNITSNKSNNIKHNQSQSIHAKTRLKMLHTLALAAGNQGMVGGQMLDMNATNSSISLDQLKLIHHLKTGALIKASTLLGVICSESASDKEIEIITQYAENIGLAFQIIDDILDETSDTSTLGKPAGADLEQGKSTYVMHLGIENARAEAKKLVEDALQLLGQLSHNTALLKTLAQLIIDRIY